MDARLLYRFGMGTALRHPNGLVPVAAALTLILAACTSPAPEPTPTSSPVATPVFASDEEALAAAEKAYADYLAVSDEIAQDGGADPERMETVAIGRGLKTAVDELREYQERGVRSIGHTSFTASSLESVHQSGNVVEVRFYVCDDVSQVDVVDNTGKSIVQPGRPVKLPFQVTASADEARLLVSERGFWEGVDYCAS